MSQYPEFPDKTRFHRLKDSVIVVTGGSSGIGAALVTVAYHHGAHVIFGDVNRDMGEALVKSLESAKVRSQSGSGDLEFLLCNVCSYGDIYALFRLAWGKHGRVNHAVFCAGVVDNPKASYFDPALTIESVGEDQGNTQALDVNFIAACAFARISLPFLRQSISTITKDRQGGSDSVNNGYSLTLLSSVTGFRDAPGMFLYQTSKQAILGLMRAMRTTIFARDGVRVNAVCPGMTDTPMTAASGMITLFKDRTVPARSNLPSHHQSSVAVAEQIASVMVSDFLNGKSIYVEEAKAWEFEDGLLREMPRWLGNEPTQWSNDNLTFLAKAFGQG
ncbi:hypothetical protein LTR84_002916 [Exophiala bonariae]|uniref:Uncharacterized protein n=1 Tax=Exophiala bonariae TaxID=1690606 RepID=A0AAV9NBU6_9EURO|nr:hypothetical protein LTR84_002916 [Exophiala bonariae]